MGNQTKLAVSIYIGFHPGERAALKLSCVVTLVGAKLPTELVCKVLLFFVVEVKHLVFGPDIFDLRGFNDFVEIFLGKRCQCAQSMTDLCDPLRSGVTQKLKQPRQGGRQMAGADCEWSFRIQNPTR